MSLKIAFQFAKGEFDEAMQDILTPIAEAGTAAIRKAGDQVKVKARGNIAAAGFSKRWQNALRVDVYPKKGVSASAAAHIYHAIPYAHVFEDGASIAGKPYLWIPLASTPKKLGRKKLTPERFEAEIGQLFTLRRPGKNPLLVARMRVPIAEAKKGPPYRVRMSALKRGGQAGGGSYVTVPIFVGIKVVNIAKKFAIRQAVQEAADDLPRLYLENLKVE
ncbi:MAG: DUF6441 family protein [Pseudomonadota bacterium]